MKKTLLLLTFMLSFATVFAQVLITPTQFNHACNSNPNGAGATAAAAFYLSEIGTEITAGLNSPNFIVRHFLTQADMVNGQNELQSPYINISNPQLIFVSVTNTITAQIQYSNYYLTVADLPNQLDLTIAACDYDPTYDGFTNFEPLQLFESNWSENGQNTVAFYHSQSDALAGINQINAAMPYQNMMPYTETLFVKAVRISTNCSRLSYLNLHIQNCVVEPTPGSPQDLYTCAVNGTLSCFNLMQNNDIIMGTLDPNNYLLTYHITPTDAQLGMNPIANPGYYCAAIQTQTVYGRLVNLSSQNYQLSSFNIHVVASPVVSEFVFESCETAPNTGITTISIGSLAEKAYQNVLTDPNTLSFQFFLSQSDAQNGVNPIESNSFTAQNQQVIYAKATNLGGCFSISPITIQITSCQVVGIPQHLSQCVEFGATACFDLNVNNNPIIGSLDPTAYTIGYFLTQFDAENNTNILTSDYCMTEGAVFIYVRLTKIADQTYQTLNFTIGVSSWVVSPLEINLDQCDDNNDGSVTFDLTTVQAQLNTTNPLTYFTDYNNAASNFGVLQNPTAYVVPISVQNTNIWVRETNIIGCDSIYVMKLHTHINCNTASNCIQANSLCQALGVPFANTQNVSISEPGAVYGCLATHPNPTWFYLPISQSGNINLKIEQNFSVDFTGTATDVDYVVYGPYSSPSSPCYNQLTADKIVSCSYSAAATEFPVISNAIDGQYYLIMVTNFSNQAGFVKISELSTTNQGGINCSGLKMNAFVDTNNNSVQDNDEINFPLGQFHYQIGMNGLSHHVISPTGIYKIYDINPSNSYHLSYTIDPNYSNNYNLLTTDYDNVSVVAGGGMTTYNFPVSVVQSYNDLGTTIIPIQQPRPGFSYKEKILYANLGSQTMATGTIHFEKDPSVSITNISEAGATVSATGFDYVFSNLLPFETRWLTVTMQIPTIPAVNLGDVLVNSVSILGQNDVVESNNSSISSQIVIGSFDPNDKMEAHGDKILFSSFDSNDFLTYTVRFENTGTASAINVKITDVLDSKLDENSIKMIDASHLYTMDRIGNQLIWDFENIQLPASIANTNVGKGYITFSIKPKPGFAVSDIITNAASIYFDFNPAVITNTFLTEFVVPLSTDDFENRDVVFYPNPTFDVVNIALQNSMDKIIAIKVYDYLGKIILSKKVSGINIQTIDLTGYAIGLYAIEITTDKEERIVKKLVKR